MLVYIWWSLALFLRWLIDSTFIFSRWLISYRLWPTFIRRKSALTETSSRATAWWTVVSCSKWPISGSIRCVCPPKTTTPMMVKTRTPTGSVRSSTVLSCLVSRSSSHFEERRTQCTWCFVVVSSIVVVFIWFCGFLFHRVSRTSILSNVTLDVSIADWTSRILFATHQFIFALDGARLPFGCAPSFCPAGKSISCLTTSNYDYRSRSYWIGYLVGPRYDVVKSKEFSYQDSRANRA